MQIPETNLSVARLGPAAYRLAIASVLAVGCALAPKPTETTAHELHALDPSKGVVIWSVSIEVENYSSGFRRAEWLERLLHGARSDRFPYRIELRSRKNWPRSNGWDVLVNAEHEAIFAYTLPAGDYEIAGLSVGNLSNRLGIQFTVYPGEVTYIGRLSTVVPERLGGPWDPLFSYELTVDDSSEAALESLEAKYERSLNDVETRLVRGLPAQFRAHRRSGGGGSSFNIPMSLPSLPPLTF